VRSIAVALTCLLASASAHAADGPTFHARRFDSRSTPTADTMPEQHGIDSAKLRQLTEYLRDHPKPVFSFLVSRHGRLVYELYTSRLTRDDAHYLLSVTKSVTSALVGAAIDRGLIAGPNAAVTTAIPRSRFASDADYERFSRLSFHDLLGMSAIDARDPPRSTTARARALQQAYLQSPDRLGFVLKLPLLPELGRSFQYNDYTPVIASGAIREATGKGAREFAEETLFRPMGFRNFEWMHRDPSGTENGAYGLRLRPIDMQKFGNLYLRGGMWNRRQLLSRETVERSFTPWNRELPTLAKPNYGWYWWQHDYGPGWLAHYAAGWKGQRIAVFPEQDLVVTMTGNMSDTDNKELFGQLIRDYIRPAVRTAGEPLPPQPEQNAALQELLEEVRLGQNRIAPDIEPRMLPQAAPKQPHF
jgi:CubicO group peptidase (beta-lactamase class C family)